MIRSPQISTKFFSLRFNTSSTAIVKINVPFKVAKITTKHLIYQDDVDPVVSNNYGVLVSTQLVKDQPIGFFHTNYFYESGVDNVIYKTLNPQPISGDFVFNSLNIEGKSLPLTGDMLLMLEFVEAEIPELI